MGADYAIQAEALTKSYGDVHAVRGVDLEVKVGECFAMLGPNGAGKTTCTEIFEGYRSRTSGTVEVLGEDPATGSRAWKARLGIVLQTSRDLTDLTGQGSRRTLLRLLPESSRPRRGHRGRRARSEARHALDRPVWRPAPTPRCGIGDHRLARCAVFG